MYRFGLGIAKHFLKTFLTPKAAIFPPGETGAQEISGETAEKEGSEVVTEQGLLNIELISFVPEGRLTIYSDDVEILSEEFEFPKNRRVFGAKRPSGKLLLNRNLSPNTENLRISLLIGSDTQLITLAPDFSQSLTNSLTITVNKKGPAETILE